jgi:hypothetical protein
MATATAVRKTDAKSPKSPKSAAASGPDAIVMLREDHKRVDTLFKQYEESKDTMSDAEKESLAKEICAELTVHAMLEEELFYPAARAALAEEGEELLDEAEVEHQTAKDLIEWIESAAAVEPLYDAKVKVLAEYIKHHVEEEHDEMFPKCRESSMDLKALGAQMQERKAELVGKA